jgi:hypothetical protein
MNSMFLAGGTLVALGLTVPGAQPICVIGLVFVMAGLVRMLLDKFDADEDD